MITRDKILIPLLKICFPPLGIFGVPVLPFIECWQIWEFQDPLWQPLVWCGLEEVWNHYRQSYCHQDYSVAQHKPICRLYLASTYLSFMNKFCVLYLTVGTFVCMCVYRGRNYAKTNYRWMNTLIYLMHSFFKMGGPSSTISPLSMQNSYIS